MTRLRRIRAWWRSTAPRCVICYANTGHTGRCLVYRQGGTKDDLALIRMHVDVWVFESIESGARL